jgi:multimeric flavodoxin WrbA
VRRLGEILAQGGEVELEVVLLGEVDLHACRGCYACQSRGELRCPLSDGLLELVERMKSADGLILASPTYTSNVSGLMKTFMDRLAWAAHRPPFLGKPALLLTTASSFGGGALRALRWFGYTGLELVGELSWPVWPSPRRDWRRGEPDERALHRAAARLATAMAAPPREPSLLQVVQLCVGRTTPATDPDFFVADDAWHHAPEAPVLRAAGWKRAIGELARWIVEVVLARRLGPRAARARRGA